MKHMLFLIFAIFALSACNFGTTAPTGDSASDPQSAQNMLPNLTGYNRTDADSITNAITAAGGSASLISGNVPAAALISRIDTMIQCYQEVGAVAANVYTQGDLSTVVTGQVPKVGAVAVINQERLVNNFLPCAVGGGSGMSAQSVQPCGGSGTKEVQGETIHYLYAGTAEDFCQTVQAHFDNLR
jgi:hypothetical protein